MQITISKDKIENGKKAALKGAQAVKDAIGKKGYANIIVATGASQFEMLAELVKADIDWSKVTAFHLDEYIGVPITHPASFRKYLKERFVDKVKNLKKFNYVDGDNPAPEKECKRLGGLIGKVNIDVAFVGIGENCHLAFNDPPADFDTEKAYIVVDLDDACRKQQLGEGWFKTFDDVPKRAISMGIKQIMKSRTIICTVPDSRKAEAVKSTVKGEITNKAPASILKKHPDCHLFLDEPAASKLA
ncbi:MAG TPA: glucosamine-6-phosphate deaminase [Lentisphaeria bacterium]|nr:MAG: glucosamine-6-phosphate deaminase [Lentisphaerae bacterium GWF2_49_21]HBC89589.1 glucosamine-6-phosphate deaminase [Lentisphaeria bacterium]